MLAVPEGLDQPLHRIQRGSLLRFRPQRQTEDHDRDADELVAGLDAKRSRPALEHRGADERVDPVHRSAWQIDGLVGPPAQATTSPSSSSRRQLMWVPGGARTRGCPRRPAYGIRLNNLATFLDSSLFVPDGFSWARPARPRFRWHGGRACSWPERARHPHDVQAAAHRDDPAAGGSWCRCLGGPWTSCNGEHSGAARSARARPRRPPCPTPESLHSVLGGPRPCGFRCPPDRAPGDGEDSRPSLPAR